MNENNNCDGLTRIILSKIEQAINSLESNNTGQLYEDVAVIVDAYLKNNHERLKEFPHLLELNTKDIEKIGRILLTSYDLVDSINRTDVSRRHTQKII